MSEEIKDKINAGLQNSKVVSHTEKAPGVHELDIHVGEGGMPLRQLAYLTGEDGEPSPILERASVITRDYIRRVDLDLLTDAGDPSRMSPDRLYNKALMLYRTKGAYGTVIDTLTNFAAKGFKNDIDDPEIKLFYDTWAREVGFAETVEKIFFDFFRVGIVRTMKIVGKFDPKLRPENFQKMMRKTKAGEFSTSEDLKTLVAYREVAAAKKIWSKSFVPLKYTILDPRLLDIKGPLLFDQTETYLKAEAFKEIRAILQNEAAASKEEREFIRTLPRDLIDQIKANKAVKIPSELVGKCDYRRQDYERWPSPRAVRAFDAMDYKDQLLKADLSTLDGITTYLMKITIGNDEFPVVDQADLVAVAKLFDTTSKSFNVVWNHTLQIEKITAGEIKNLLGQEKFAQVNDDLTQAWGVTRALLDGSLTGNSEAIGTAVKAFSEEINFARRCVSRWIEKEYEEIALALGFDRYPRPRFDENALKDEIMFMSVVQGMIDRRIISYETGIEMLGLDFANEMANMIQEKPHVMAGDFGIIGSPYNPKALPPQSEPPSKDTTPSGNETVVTKKDLTEFQKNIEKMVQEGISNIQKTQRTPKGTPSEGRPRKGGATKPLKKQVVPNTKPPKKPKPA